MIIGIAFDLVGYLLMILPYIFSGTSQTKSTKKSCGSFRSGQMHWQMRLRMMCRQKNGSLPIQRQKRSPQRKPRL